MKIFAGGSTVHQFSGFTVYHKMAEKRKYYPYINGTLKALLFAGKYRRVHFARYLLWYVFYMFFADAFHDRQLGRRLEFSHRLVLLPNEEFAPTAAFSISHARAKGAFSNASSLRAIHVPLSLASLLLFKKYEIYTDTITLKESRAAFLLGLALASLLVPFRLARAVLNLASCQGEMKKVKFPIYPKDLGASVEIFLKLVRDRRL
jgi:hypothetical protein